MIYAVGSSFGKCGVDTILHRVILDDSTEEEMWYSVPILEGDWQFDIDIVDLTPFLDLERDMLRVDIKQVALCGAIDPVYDGELAKITPAFIFPCLNYDPADPPNGCSNVPFLGVPLGAAPVVYDQFGSPRDCCDNGAGYAECTIAKADLTCPIVPCTNAVFLIHTYKLRELTFSITLDIAGNLITPGGP